MAEVKLCVACRHYRHFRHPNEEQYIHSCARKTSLVTGNLIYLPAEVERNIRVKPDEAISGVVPACGAEGYHYSEKLQEKDNGDD